MGKKRRSGEAAIFDVSASRGLFVGISSFKHPQLTKVAFAVDDAVDLAALFCDIGLLEPDGCVLAVNGDPVKKISRDRLATLLAAGARRENPSHANLYDQLHKVAVSSKPDGILIATFASHGMTYEGIDYLLTEESTFVHLVRTSLPFSDVFDKVAQAGAERRLVLIDACRSRLDRGVDPPPALPAELQAAILRAKGQCILAGTVPNGSTYDDHELGNGVFTGAVIDALRGGAEANAESFITAQTVARHAQEAIRTWVARFRPDLKDPVGPSVILEPLDIAENLALVQHPGSDAVAERVRQPSSGSLAPPATPGRTPSAGRSRAQKRRPWIDWGIALSTIGLVATLATWLIPRSTREPPAIPGIYAVRVQVLDADGRPLRDSTVRTSAGNEPQALPDGWWEIEVPSAKLPATGRLTLRADHADWEGTQSEITLAGDPNLSVEIRLQPPQSWLRGRVTDSRGRSAAGVRVAPADGVSGAATTDTGGRFELQLPLPRDQRVRVAAERAGQGPVETYCYTGRDSCAIALESP